MCNQCAVFIIFFFFFYACVFQCMAIHRNNSHREQIKQHKICLYYFPCCLIFFLSSDKILENKLLFWTGIETGSDLFAWKAFTLLQIFIIGHWLLYTYINVYNAIICKFFCLNFLRLYGRPWYDLIMHTQTRGHHLTLEYEWIYL